MSGNVNAATSTWAAQIGGGSGAKPVTEKTPASASHMPPPYGAEPPDYERYNYGYPPFSGRMFGSGR